MFKILQARFHQGHRTGSISKNARALPQRYRGVPAFEPERCMRCRKCSENCPVDAVTAGDSGVKIDLGKCLFCGSCRKSCPNRVIDFSSDFRMAVCKREELIMHSAVLPQRVKLLNRNIKRLFGRSLKLRQVSAGGCNACESDINVLSTVVFDLGRFGIQFVASPRHADGLLITGPVTGNMKLALQKTYIAVAAPKIVIAAGSCAISGGPYADLAQVSNGASSTVPVDLYIPGCPPHPLTTLDGLLRLTGKL